MIRYRWFDDLFEFREIKCDQNEESDEIDDSKSSRHYNIIIYSNLEKLNVTVIENPGPMMIHSKSSRDDIKYIIFSIEIRI